MVDSGSLQKLVGLFLQGAFGDESVTHVTRDLSAEEVARGVESTEKILLTEDAIKMGGSPAPTFVCIAMALEDQPHLHAASIACYEASLKYLSGRGPVSWERIVVKQQLGSLCAHHGRARDAVAWLTDCADECRQAIGHPRDAVLFGGNFQSKHTRMEFSIMVEQLLASAYYKDGDMAKAQTHFSESKRLESLKGGDAVERSASTDDSGPTSIAGNMQQLWSATPNYEMRLKEYRFSDEGPTVLLILDLNDHLGLHEEASALVDSLQQFRVLCETNSVDVRLRLRHEDGSIREFRLCFRSLSSEIVPEDTVPRLRGREGKRRLEVKLSKRDSARKWPGDFGTLGEPKATDGKVGRPPPPKDTLLNPMAAEELARLPKPFDANVDNRPSSYAGPRAGYTAPLPADRASRADCKIRMSELEVEGACLEEMD